MPIIEPGSWLHAETRPDWTDIGSIGRFAVAVDGGRFERHSHHVDEVWTVWEGKGKIFVDGEESYVQAGDIVLTRAGDVHDVVEVYETLRGFFLETGLDAGHVNGVAHDVPTLPLPADFPLR